MAGRYPKADSIRSTRLEFGWVDLPASHDYCPPLPSWRKWHRGTREMWKHLWSKGQAAMWDQSGSSLWGYATLWDEVHSGTTTLSKASAELRQHEAAHGLNPKAMLQLRWRLPTGATPVLSPADAAAVAPIRTVTDERRRTMKITADGYWSNGVYHPDQAQA